MDIESIRQRINNHIASLEDLRVLLSVVDSQCTDPAIQKAAIDAALAAQAQESRLAAARAVSDSADRLAAVKASMDKATAELIAANADLAAKQRTVEELEAQAAAPAKAAADLAAAKSTVAAKQQAFEATKNGGQ